MLKLYNSVRQKLANNKTINKLIIVYAFTVLSYQILYLIIPFRQAVESLRLEFISPLLAVIGFFIFAWDLLIDRTFFKTKYSYLLIGLIAVMIISSLINAEYGLVDNIKAIIWQISQLLVIFPLYKRVSKEEIAKILKIYFPFVSIIFVVANLVSLFQYFASIGYNTRYDGGLVRQGFLEGRLFGIFGSPHFASLFMLILAIASVYFAVSSDKKTVKILYGAAMIIYFLYAVASGTRSVIVAAACTAFIVVLLWAYNRYSFKKCVKPLLKSAICVVMSICVAVGTVVVFNVSDKAMKGIIRIYADSIDNDTSGTDENTGEIMLDRADVSNENISNHRFEIWEDYFTVATDRIDTLILGMAPGSYMVSIRENFPNLFVVKYIKENYPLMYSKELIYDTHNAYIGAFVMAGILGVILLMIFLVCGFVRTVRYIAKNKKVSLSVYTILAVVVLILAASFFESDLFFRCTSTSVIFWLVTGILLMVTEPTNKIQSESDNLNNK